MTDTKGSMTAKICSFARAYHSNYSKEKIFDDYLAYDIMGKDEYERIGTLIHHNFDETKIDKNYHFRNESIHDVIAEYLVPIPLSRIRFAEEKLQEFAKTR